MKKILHSSVAEPASGSETRRKIRLFACTLGAIMLLDFGLGGLVLHSLGYANERVVLDLHWLQFRFVHWGNTGAAWSLFRGNSVLLAPISALTCTLLSTVLGVIPSRYRAQFVSFSIAVAGALTNLFWRLRFGYVPDYLYLCLKTETGNELGLPAFNIADVAISAGILIFCFLLPVLSFFRWIPRWTESKITPITDGAFHDPLYEKRRWLKLVLIFLGLPVVVISAVTTGLFGIMLIGSAFSEDVGRQVSTADGFSTVIAVLNVGLSLFSAAAVIVAWRLIPKRPIDLLFLRSFRTDKRGWAAAHDLRRLIDPGLRLSGVTDPWEARRWIYLPYWLSVPFVFAVGDFSRVNAFRHHLFLGDEWREGVRRAFQVVRGAIFDCRSLSENLLWEVNAGLACLHATNTFFIIPDDEPVERFVNRLAECLVGPHGTEDILADNCFTATQIPQLALRLKECYTLHS